MMEEKQLLYKNANLYYKIAGKGNPVVLLHGFAEDSSIWDGIAVNLSAQYRLLIPDIAGSGKSTLLAGNNIGMEDYAECIFSILTKENIKECVMIGHSMGGYITLAFAQKYPQMLKAIGLFHSSAFADDEAKIENRNKAIEFIRQNGSHAFLKTSIPGLFADAIKSNPDIDHLIEKGKVFLPDAFIQYYKAMIARPDRTEVFRTYPLPVLFVLGMHDKAVPFEQGLQQSYLPFLSHIKILRHSAHMGMLEEKEKAFRILADFLHSVYV